MIHYKHAPLKRIIASLVIVLTALLTIAWLYTARCFEQNITCIYNFLNKSGYATFTHIKISKYALKASFANPVFINSPSNTSIKFNAGDCLKVSYNMLTKTITVRITGNETLYFVSGTTLIPLIHMPKHNDYNAYCYKITLNSYFPHIVIHKPENDMTETVEDTAKTLENSIKQIKSIQLKGENGLIEISTPFDTILGNTSIGQIAYKQFNYNLLPYLSTTTTSDRTLHINSEFSYSDFAFISAENAPINPHTTPSHVTGKTTSTIHLGSQEKIRQTIRHFRETGDWGSVLTAFNVESQSKGKRSYQGQNHTYTLSTTFNAPAKTIELNFDGNDLFDASWKHEYLPTLRSLIKTYQQIDAGQEQPDDATLLNILPAIENNNPITSLINVHVDFNGTKIDTNIRAGYACKRHGATLALSLPIQKDALFDTEKLFDINHKSFESLFKEPITINLTLKNSDSLFDDVQAIATRALSAIANNDLAPSITAGRAIVNKSVQLMAQKSMAQKSAPEKALQQPNETFLHIAYDVKTNTLTYGNKQGFDQLLATIVPDIVQTIGITHDHHDHSDNTQQPHEEDASNNGSSEENGSETEMDDNTINEDYSHDYANNIAGDLSPHGMPSDNRVKKNT